MMKTATEKNTIVYACHYYEFRHIQQAVADEVRKRPCFWFSWHNCMELVIDTAWDLGHRHLPGVVEDELIRWLMEDFEG